MAWCEAGTKPGRRKKERQAERARKLCGDQLPIQSEIRDELGPATTKGASQL